MHQSFWERVQHLSTGPSRLKLCASNYSLAELPGYKDIVWGAQDIFLIRRPRLFQTNEVSVMLLTLTSLLSSGYCIHCITSFITTEYAYKLFVWGNSVNIRMLLPKDQRSCHVTSLKNCFSRVNALSFNIRKLHCHEHKHLQLKSIHTAYYLAYYCTLKRDTKHGVCNGALIISTNWCLLSW